MPLHTAFPKVPTIPLWQPNKNKTTEDLDLQEMRFGSPWRERALPGRGSGVWDGQRREKLGLKLELGDQRT